MNYEGFSDHFPISLIIQDSWLLDLIIIIIMIWYTNEW
jgi:hypothetical protein